MEKKRRVGVWPIPQANSKASQKVGQVFYLVKISLKEMAGRSESRRPDELGELQSVSGELFTDTTAYSPSLVLANP